LVVVEEEEAGRKGEERNDVHEAQPRLLPPSLLFSLLLLELELEVAAAVPS